MPEDAFEASAALERPRDLIVAVVGPTASGKSDLALDLAERLPEVMGTQGTGEIVSADALQLYRGMDIGTAKTPVAQRRGIPHHQIDVLDLSEEASVARYQKEARADIAAIHSRGAVAVVAGGSGLYQRALLDVIDFPGTDPGIRQALEAEAAGPMGSRGLHARLVALDPASAARIDPHNARRIIRALEVIEITGRPYSSHMPAKMFIRPAVMIAIRHPLEVLDERIRIRTRRMFDDGLIDETRRLIDQGLRDAKTARMATGYAQAISVIDEEMSIDEAVESIEVATRQLARRQIKWLRPDHRVHWIDSADEEHITSRAIDIVQRAIEAYSTDWDPIA